MNEFTKEELGFLINAVKSYDEDNCFDLFIKKIQYMIDNYCEHKNGGEGYNCSECRDCGARW